MMDTPEFKRGRAGERVVANALQRRGWFIVPSYDYTGQNGDKAPKMQGLNLSLVIPDLDAARRGKRFWVEVKTKARPDFTRSTGQWEHGIAKRHLEHYRRVEIESGAPVWLMIVEEQNALLIGQSLAKLGTPRIYEGWKMGRGGMAFWPRERFRLIERLGAS